MAEVLRIENLHTRFPTSEGVVKAVNGVSLSLQEDSILVLVGESGSGKTVTALSILGLVPYPGQVAQGKVYFNGLNLLEQDAETLRHIRGRDISMIFQDPRASLNPVLSVGKQMEEAILTHRDVSRQRASQTAQELLEESGLPDPHRMLTQYPFQLSGGMCQRVMIAMALALGPKVLIADEPTSNLDVTLQADILQRLKYLCQQHQTSILLITHDMGVVAQMADEVAVMYAGVVVEHADVKSLFQHPFHPYTWGLFQAIPRLDQPQRLRPLRGSGPDLINLGEECPYLPRCPKATNTCRLNPKPPLGEVMAGHWAACYNLVTHDRD
ncbi:MAG: ABC transporter ATP-binding protein [Dehalococcoidia bacterium]